jgi:uncharacterized Zn finger protein (UPF0148 family)
MYKNKKVNIIGFNFHSSDRYIPSKVCVIHYGTPLISKKDEPGVLWCPECGTPYSEKDTATSEDIKGKFKGPNQKTNIISAKKKRKYYDKQGNLITDPDLIQDIERGATVYSYREEKSGEENEHHLVRR